MSTLREEGYFEGTTIAREPFDTTSRENLFDIKMVTVIHKLARLSPSDCAQLLATFEDQYRLEFLKSGLRLMTAHEEGEAPSGILPSDSSADFLRSIVETRNVERLVQTASAPALYGEISSALAEGKPLPLVEAVVDKYGLTRIWGATDMADWIDTQSVQPLVGERIDITNLLLAARSKALGIAADQTEQVLVSVNYRLGDALSEAASSGSVTSALRAFTKTVYGSSVAPFLDSFREGDSLHPLEVSLRRRHATSCLYSFSGFPFCAGIPLAFAYLMDYELLDLRAIISGKDEGLAADRLEQFLIL